MNTTSPVCCTLSELELGLQRLKQSAITDGHWVKYNPISAVTGDSTSAEFFIRGSKSYIDLLHTYVYWKVKIVKANGNNLDADEDVAFVNLIHASLCKQVNVSLNGKPISPAQPNYDLRAYITVLGSYGSEAKSSQLQAMGWKADKEGHMEASANNTGYTERKGWTAQSASYDVIGPIFSDIFQQPKFLLNNVDLRIQFVFNAPEKCLMVPDTNNNQYKFVVEEAYMQVRKATISPEIMLHHTNMLTKGVSLGYNILKTEVKNYTVPAGFDSYTVEDVGLGRLPQEIVVCFVRNDAFSGTWKKNPYNFKHYNVSSFALFADGHQIPSDPFTPDWGNNGNGCFAREYMNNFISIGKSMVDEGNAIPRKAFSQGFTMFSINLRPDLSDGTLEQPNQKGTLRLEVSFKEDLPHVMNIICMLVFDNNILIDRNRNVIIDYTP